MKATKVLITVAALVAIGGMLADTWAQCPNPRIFRSAGKFGNNVKFDTTGAESGGNEIGRFWDTRNAETSNNGLDGPDFGNLCRISDWWYTDGALFYIDGALTADSCMQLDCPDRDLTLVVEDYDSEGPPGMGGTAYYMGLAVTETPPSGRWFDYGTVDDVTSATTIPMLEFPKPRILYSSRSGLNVEVALHYADQGDSVHTWLDGGVAPTDSVVSEWHLMAFTGQSDPGRLRSHWTKVAAVPYVDGGIDRYWTIPCHDNVNDEFLAVGIGFNGGSAGVVDSALVGAVVALECDPFLADPDAVKPEFKPAHTGLQTQPGRSGGRR